MYSSSVPDYNRFRLIPPEEVDETDLVCLKFNVPYDLLSLFHGLLSLGSEINLWREENGKLTPEECVDAWNNLIMSLDCCTPTPDQYRVRSEDCVLMEYRDNVPFQIVDLRECFSSSVNDEDVYDNAEPVGDSTAALDCVWGGVDKLVDLLVDRANSLLDILDTAISNLEALSKYLSTIGFVVPSARWIELGELVGSIVVTVARVWINDTANQDAIKCDLFCLIRGNGGTLTSEILQDWIDNIQPDIPPYEPGQTAMRLTALSYPRQFLFGRYALAYNDQCGDDWLLLCQCEDCFRIEDFGSPAVVITTGILEPSGAVSGEDSGGAKVISVGLTFGLQVSITEIRVHWFRSSSSSTSNLQIFAPPTNELCNFSGGETGDRTDVCDAGGVLAEQLSVFIDSVPQIALYWIEIQYVGGKVAIGIDCP